MKVVSMIRASLAPGVDAWGYSLKLLMAAIVVGGGAILGQYTVSLLFVCPVFLALLDLFDFFFFVVVFFFSLCGYL